MFDMREKVVWPKMGCSHLTFDDVDTHVAASIDGIRALLFMWFEVDGGSAMPGSPDGGVTMAFSDPT